MNLITRIRARTGTANWDSLSRRIDCLDDKFIIEHIEKFHLLLLPKHYKLPEHILRATQDRIHWGNVSYIGSKLFDASIREFANRLDWDKLALYYRSLPEELIRENLHRFQSWRGISRMKLSIEFIREFADRLEWSLMFFCNGSIFSEEFIREFADYLNWSMYSAHHPHPIPKLVYEYQHRCDLQITKVRELVETHQMDLEEAQQKRFKLVEAMAETLNNIVPREILAVVAAYM